MNWSQNYDPLGNAFLSTLIAGLPIVVLLGLLASGKVHAPLASLIGLFVAVCAAGLVFVPVEASVPGHAGKWEWMQTILIATMHGAAFGLFPIGWIVLAAIFLYSLTVETGHFEIVKQSVISISDDRRLQALLIAFCFGAFVEGAAGFGTPVAISAALMMGAGFKPIHAAGLALIANTSPVAFGALGTPTLTLAEVTMPREVVGGSYLPDMRLDVWWQMQLSKMAGRQLPFFSLIVPAWLVFAMAGWRGVVGVWPALLVCGGTFALVQFVVANFIGPQLVDVAGGLITLAVSALFLRFWKPRQVWRFPDEPEAIESPRRDRRSFVATVNAWVPWALLSLAVLLFGIPAIRTSLEGGEPHHRNMLAGVGSFLVPVPGLHLEISRVPPVVSQPEPEKALYRFNWLSATGTGIFVAAICSALWLRVRPRQFVLVLWKTMHRMRWPLFTIACMLALAYVTRYSGMDATLGLAFTKTGWLYPFFAALLGWLGVALTGSDTSSNALFGSLQKITAEGLVQQGVLPESVSSLQAVVLLATANSTGGVMGKMIDAQSIVVSAAATNQAGQEGAILRFVFWHSLILAILMGMLVMFQAYVWTSSIPS